jgi:transcription elongation factor GreA
MLGSTVKVETGGDELTYTIVGTADANIAAGRLSSASPVGAALLGATAGQDIDIQTPRGPIRYRVLSVE